MSDTGEETKSVLKSLSDERAFLSCAALRMLVKICLTKQEKRKFYRMTNTQKVLVSDNDLILLWFSPPGKPYLRQPFKVTFNRPLKVEWNLLICIFGRKAIANGNKTDIGNPLNTSRKPLTALKNFLLPIACIMCRMIGLQFNRQCYSGE